MSAFLLGVVAMTAVLDWVCTAILLRAALGSGSVALRERAGVSVVLAVAITAYLAVGVNTELGFPWFDLDGTQVLNRLVLTTVGVIPARWLWLYWRGRFA
jgi:hypothetical protein